MVEDLLTEPENMKKAGILALGTASGLVAGYIKDHADETNETFTESLGEGFKHIGAAYLTDEIAEYFTDVSLLEPDDYIVANFGYAVGDSSVEKIDDYLSSD